MAKSCNREISYFPRPFSGKQYQNFFISEIIPNNKILLRRIYSKLYYHFVLFESVEKIKETIQLFAQKYDGKLSLLHS